MTELGTKSRVFHFADLPAATSHTGGESRQILAGTLPIGEAVSLHESMQPAGMPPNLPHRIQHTEFICLRSGQLDFLHDGIVEHAAAGDVLFVANGTLHGVRNTGRQPAEYFVLALGGDVHG